jgi:HKD family nuclease
MEIKIVDNQKIKMVDELNQLISISERINIAVAFAKKTGFLRIKESLKRFFEKKGEAIFLLGLDFHTTDPETLWELIYLSESGFNIRTFCYSGNLEGTATYHPKLYIFEQANKLASYIVGSSNLTNNGLERNIEINVEITSPVYEKHFSDVMELFNQLKVTKRRIAPNREYIEKYSEVFEESNKGREILKTKSYRELKELEKELPTPKITSADLYGWMRLVYDCLPNEEFSTTQIYSFRNEFKQKYPNNLNIDAKIRQQLQFLEKFGLIEKIDRNLWRKI